MTTAAVAEAELSWAGASRPRQPGSPAGPQSLALGSRRFSQRRAEPPQGTYPRGAPVHPQPSSDEELDCLHSPGLQLVEK